MMSGDATVYTAVGRFRRLCVAAALELSLDQSLWG